MSVTGTSTVRAICDAALLKAGVSDITGESDAETAAVAMRSLQWMLKAWQAQDFLSFTASQTVTLTTAASYTLSPVRPLRIHSARLVRSGVETPMQRLTRQEYDELPVKTTLGLPTCFYYDRQREAAVFYVWPVLSAANGETVKLTYEREVEDLALNDTLDLPAEWYEATALNLAVRLLTDFQRPADQLLLLSAAQALQDARSFYDEAVIFER